MFPITNCSYFWTTFGWIPENSAGSHIHGKLPGVCREASRGFGKTGLRHEALLIHTALANGHGDKHRISYWSRQKKLEKDSSPLSKQCHGSQLCCPLCWMNSPWYQRVNKNKASWWPVGSWFITPSNYRSTVNICNLATGHHLEYISLCIPNFKLEVVFFAPIINSDLQISGQPRTWTWQNSDVR